VDPEAIRIAMLSVHSCPAGELGTKDTGGMSVYIRELARELGKRGHWIDVYTRFHDPKDDQIVHLGENARLIHIKAGDPGEMHKLTIYPYLTEFTFALENFRKRHGLSYDLVHSHYWLSGRVGRWLQCLWDIPHIVMFHTLGEVKNAMAIGEDEPDLRLVTERGLVKNCHRIIAATKREKRELIQYYHASPENIGVVPGGVNMELFKPVEKDFARQQLGVEKEIKMILYVGRIDPIKGINRLLEAGAYLPNKQEFKLVIIGGNDQPQPELEKLRRLSQALDIHDSVIFAGRVKQEELPLYYSAADVLVMPSYYESFGLVALESMACGTPVIATKVGGIEKIVHKGLNGYQVTGHIPRSIAEKISMFTANPRVKANSPFSIRTSITKFCWSKVADAIINEYRVMLGSPIPQAAYVNPLQT